MFIYSMRANTLKLLAVICLSVLVLVALLIFIPDYSSPSAQAGREISYKGVKDAADAVEFLRQFGYEVKSEPREVLEVTIPTEFDKIFAGYNEIQKSEGLDLSKYKGKDLLRYTFEVTNCTDCPGLVLANVLVYKNRVVGGDICSDSFVRSFSEAHAGSYAEAPAESAAVMAAVVTTVGMD